MHDLCRALNRFFLGEIGDRIVAVDGNLAGSDIDLGVGVKPGLEQASENNEQNGGDAAEKNALHQIFKGQWIVSWNSIVMDTK